MDTINQEVKNNYEAFEEMLPKLVTTHPGKFALMRKRQLIEVFDTARDAYVAGQKLYEDKLFSVQEIINTPINLGFFSYALS